MNGIIYAFGHPVYVFASLWSKYPAVPVVILMSDNYLHIFCRNGVFRAVFKSETMLDVRTERRARSG